MYTCSMCKRYHLAFVLVHTNLRNGAIGFSFSFLFPPSLDGVESAC